MRVRGRGPASQSDQRDLFVQVRAGQAPGLPSRVASVRLFLILLRLMARYARRPASGLPRPRGPWKQGPIPVIGLIGGIGAGKSRVAAALAARGAKVLD